MNLQNCLLWFISAMNKIKADYSELTEKVKEEMQKLHFFFCGR